MLLIALSVQAQEALTVKFTAATETGGYVPFTSVMVTDLTQGWMTTLAYPDTVLILSPSLVGVGEGQGLNFNMGSAFPNPFKDETCVPLELSEASEVTLQVIRADGRMVATRDMRLDSGVHQVMVRLSAPGMAFLRVVMPLGSSVVRLVCMGHGDADDVKVVSRGVAMERGGNPGVFEPGDLMRYEAFRSVGGTTFHSTVVEQAQYISETVTLLFPVEAPEGAIDGLFTINDNGEKAYFSKGNLQYDKNIGVWSFMEHQYDRVETLGQDVGVDYADQDTVSLFGWGTSGYNHGANCYQPWSTSTTYSDYYAYGNYQYNLYDQTGQADWGYNPISNGGNTANQWRTLTKPEWDYVFNMRSTTSGIRYAKANVNNVNGVILLPDDWNSSIYSLSNTNSSEASFSSNPLTASQWSTLEQAGAVFLPAAGYRNGTLVDSVGSCGGYWSASFSGPSYAYSVYMDDSFPGTYGHSGRCYGWSVRLVRVVEN